MAELKTRKTTASVDAFLKTIADPVQQSDARELVRMMSRITGLKPALWGTIVAFGEVHLRYPTGRELDWFQIGFAPRKGATTIYLGCGAVDPASAKLLAKLGPHALGVGCLYLKRLADVDPKVLGALLESSARSNAAQHVEPSAPKPAKGAKGARKAKVSRVNKGAKGARAMKGAKGAAGTKASVRAKPGSATARVSRSKAAK